MFETIFSIIITVVMTLLWGIAAIAAAGLPYSKSSRSLNNKSTFLLWVAGIAFVLSAAWYGVITLQLIKDGWLFVEGTVKMLIPLTLIPQLYIAGAILPRLKSLRNAGGEPPTPAALEAVAQPSISISFLAAALVSGISALSTFFVQPVLPSLSQIGSRYLVVALLLLVPAIFANRRYSKLKQGKPLRRGLGARLISFVSAGLLTAMVAITLLVANVLVGVQVSKLPEASDMMNHDWIDEGGGAPTLMSGSSNHQQHQAHHASASVDPSQVEVASLTGDISEPADRTFELVAQQKKVTLASGAVIDAWTYNGEIAPELRVKQGEMIEVKLVNQDIDRGVTIHWHGYNVPNAMDGVPGMTQNVVKPGQSFTYKFRANQEGTYWFHSHQQAAEQVVRGLFGTLIVEPKQETESYDEEITLINHQWETDQGRRKAFGNQDEFQWKQVKPGDTVKLRIINAYNYSEKFLLQGTEFRITSIDGMRIQDPKPLSDQTAFRLGAGGRYDVVFTMPDRPVFFKLVNRRNEGNPGTVFYAGSRPERPVFQAESAEFDPSDYGKPVMNEVTAEDKFDREFHMILGNRMGFYNGQINFLWTINGEVYPRVPTFVVKEGDRVKTTFVNRSLGEHPMHLHGHHMTVLKKNGKKVATPWLTDTLNVMPGESYEVGFIADNPGMWMDHCHNLDHAATGMTLHLMYDHVLPSYEVGTRSGNIPD
ncbi:multicopper oxidase family protein [Paenibacillus sp. FSL K6-1566]|uniref:FtsP/CotA-like multicopper oxidase with cupredoxin domain n=1 Tax=Paenibacillus lactis TaxID=228574 RepID=A0ABS4F546_9BACL|nr:multicopper oxidase family protein [Paenibacillus lactis]MBP1891375.1 FtsP/CotA-like multicopper oxidase with cupredoxin domain [Paenibacillus lactis]MCM3493812.1 multicopper oxidase family protein [Paenibacillus lactis]HAF98253.1 copper oxidase [Paenibacillus lactis]